jgi:predicted DNA-binding WGR domain protein
MRIEFQTERRGYLLTLERDMFNVFVLFRRWYGLGHRRGGVKRQVFFDEDTALREVRRIERLRFRRGYRVIDLDFGK